MFLFEKIMKFRKRGEQQVLSYFLFTTDFFDLAIREGTCVCMYIYVCMYMHICILFGYYILY